MTARQSITVDGTTYLKAPEPTEAPLSIIVADRGWVFVGHMRTDEASHKMHDARVVRRWGTSKGLAELAIRGPSENTKLDTAAAVTIPNSSVVAVFTCDESKWQ